MPSRTARYDAANERARGGVAGVVQEDKRQRMAISDGAAPRLQQLRAIYRERHARYARRCLRRIAVRSAAKAHEARAPRQRNRGGGANPPRRCRYVAMRGAPSTLIARLRTVRNLRRHAAPSSAIQPRGAARCYALHVPCRCLPYVYTQPPALRAAAKRQQTTCNVMPERDVQPCYAPSP